MSHSLPIGNSHASAVAFDDFGILIVGRSGSGKSELALKLIDKGAKLISDDVVIIGETLELTKPPKGPDLIEIRNIGLLHAPMQKNAKLSLVVDLELAEPKRLPPLRHTRIGDHEVVLIAGKGIPNLDVTLKHYAKFGRAHPN